MITVLQKLTCVTNGVIGKRAFSVGKNCCQGLRSSYQPNNLEKRFLVWTGKYKTLAEVPDMVSIAKLLNQIHDVAKRLKQEMNSNMSNFDDAKSVRDNIFTAEARVPVNQLERQASVGFLIIPNSPFENKFDWERRRIPEMNVALAVVRVIESHEVMERSRNKMRIRVANIMMVLTLVGCITMVISGKKAFERGESVTKQNLDWHKRYNELHATDDKK